jgi:N-methylhydantoinase A
MTLRLGIDTGGTFTDVVAFDESTGRLSFHKVASTPDDPGSAIVQGAGDIIQRCGATPDAVDMLIHGTTVATNAVLQRRGAKVALVTTAGFRDVLQIQRQDRPRLYDLRARRARPLVPRSLRLELDERMLFDGSVHQPVDMDSLARVIDQLKWHEVEAVAVGLLHSYANPAHELQVGAALREQLPDVTVCLSHETVGEHGEYERFSTCAMNAYVQPVMQRYLHRLETALAEHGHKGSLYVMKSSGGVMSAQAAGQQCVDTILSGPAGGVVCGAAIAAQHGNHNVITADMGGTSFDVSVVHDGEAAFARDSEMGGLALATPMLDIHTVGAGGGSIGWIDAGHALRVGPHSACALPGPACYGRGGTEPTVTDANLALGRLAATSLLGGDMSLDIEAARRAIHDHLAAPLGMSIEHAAEGMIRVVNATMTAAIRKLTVERGHDPRDFVLCPFGGAGPLHGADLAAEMNIKQCVVPLAPGVNSAIGLLMSNLREDRTRTHVVPLDGEHLGEVAALFDELASEATQRMTLKAGRIRRTLGMRYLGQRYEIPVPVADGKLNVETIARDFHAAHEKMYGYQRPGEPVQIASVWASAEVDIQAIELPKVEPATHDPQPIATRRAIFRGEAHDTPIYHRDALGAGAKLIGPAVIEQLDSTTVLWPDQSLVVDDYGQLVIRVKEATS